MSAEERNEKVARQDVGVTAGMPAAGGEHLKALIKQLIKEEQYEGVALLFTSASEAAKNVALLPEISMDLYEDLCINYLTAEVYETNPSLFFCIDDLLKTIAGYAPPERFLIELLELLEENHCECVFTSALRAMQVILLRVNNKKNMALEWSLESILTRLATISSPCFLYEGYDEKQKGLLEQDEAIQNLLMHHLTLGLFYGPLIDEACSEARKEAGIFRNCQPNNRRNIMCCFLVKLLAKPLGLLDLENSEDKKTNTYSLQCARSATQGITKCLVDPYFLLSFVETRLRRKRPLNEEITCSNIFLIEEKLPLYALAIYYYMVIVEGIDSAKIPLVYNPLYVCEAGIYLAHELLAQEEPALHDKALKLVEKLLSNLGHRRITSSALDLSIHRTFCEALCSLVGYSSQTHLRQQGVHLLRQYIHAFDDEGKYLILKNLMRVVKHQGICGYLATIYKDLVAGALKSTTTPLPQSFIGEDFRAIFLQHICRLEQGVETNLIENSDKIISSLNALRYFALKDCENRTGFWTFCQDIDIQFLTPLRQALDLSEAHFKAELQKVREGRDLVDMQQLQLLDISIGNENAGTGMNFQLDRDKKIEILNQNLCSFDLMRSLLGRVCECLDNRSPRANNLSTGK